jgi:predicted  nucleic acid-binding Zn-ribbon protein
MKIMAEEYIAESGTHAVDFDGMEEEIMRTFERLCKEPSDSAVVQLAAVVERLFERTRRAEEHLHADPEEFAAMRHQLETLKQQVQDLQTELRTVKENHELVRIPRFFLNF